MAEIYWSIQDVFRSMFGFAFAAGLMYFIFYRSAFRWQYLAQVYARPWGSPISERRFQTIILYGMRPGGNILKGVFTIGVEEEGIAFKSLWLFAPFHEPLFIPFDDIKGWNQTWYLNDKSVELEFARAPEVKMLLAASEFQWIREFAGRRLEYRHDQSPHNDKPLIFYWATLLMGILGIGLVLALAGSFLGFWNLPIRP